MVGWHDARRELFLDSIRHAQGIEILSDNRGDILLSSSIVNVNPDVDAQEAMAALRSFSPTIRSTGTFEVNRDGRGAAYAVAQEHSAFVRPNYVCIAQQRMQPGNDPELSMPLPPIPRGTSLGEGVKVAVVDTGVADQPGARDVWTNHAEHRILNALDPLHDDRSPEYLAWAGGHGTFIGSLVRQIAPAANIIPIKACSPMGYASEDAIADGIDRAVEAGAEIISLSWCTYAMWDPNSSSYLEPVRLRQSINNAVNRDIVVVAAAGNSASPHPMYPAAWPDVVGVGALDREGNRWEHSNYGEWVDAWALGYKVRGVYVEGRENPANDPDGHAEVWDNYPGTNYATWTGTSFSAPIVAGQIALLKSAIGCDAPKAKEALLAMSRSAPDDPTGKRVVVDLPGQT
jgi:subtilisin family serine protease